MVEKLTPLSAHLTRSGVPVYSVNSRSHTQVPDGALMLPTGIRVDVRVLRRVGRMADIRTGSTPIPATFG